MGSMCTMFVGLPWGFISLLFFSYPSALLNSAAPDTSLLVAGERERGREGGEGQLGEGQGGEEMGGEGQGGEGRGGEGRGREVMGGEGQGGDGRGGAGRDSQNQSSVRDKLTSFVGSWLSRLRLDCGWSSWRHQFAPNKPPLVLVAEGHCEYPQDHTPCEAEYSCNDCPQVVLRRLVLCYAPY